MGYTSLGILTTQLYESIMNQTLNYVKLTNILLVWCLFAYVKDNVQSSVSKRNIHHTISTID